MTQFIRDNINMISTKVQRKPQPQEPSNSTRQDDSLNLSHKTSAYSEAEQTIIRNGLSPTIFQNYPINAHSESASKHELVSDQTTVSYQSAFDTIPRDTNMSKKSEYELQTQDPLEEMPILNVPQTNTYQSINSLETEVASIGDSNAIVGWALWLAIRLISTVKCLKDRMMEYRRGTSGPHSDLERQPLVDNRPNIHEDHEIHSDEDEQYFSCIANRTFLTICTAVVCIGLVVTILVTGDTDLLVKVFQGLLCYLLGISLSDRLFGPSFCPRFVQ